MLRVALRRMMYGDGCVMWFQHQDAAMLLLRGRITERVGALFDRNVTLGFKLDNLDAPWEYSEEPHVKRRQVRAGRLTKMKMFFF